MFLFFSLKKGPTPKMGMLCIVVINSVLFNLFWVCLDLVANSVKSHSWPDAAALNLFSLLACVPRATRVRNIRAKYERGDA